MKKTLALLLLLAVSLAAQLPSPCRGCGGTVSKIVATYTASGLSGAVASFDLVAAASVTQAGQYLVARYGRTSAVAGGTCSAAAAFGYTEGGNALTMTAGSYNLNSLNNVISYAQNFYIDAGTAITYSIAAPSGAGCGSGTARFMYHLVVIKIH